MKTRNMRALFVASSLFAAGAAILGSCAGAAAQPTALKPGDELRPLYATDVEIAEGKRLVESSCAGCHGLKGINTNPGVPNLAGQRPAYLYIELKAYQTGARGIGAMTNTVKILNDDAFIAAAAYFASLEPAEPAATGGARVPIIDPVQAGKTAAAACVGCHGETGVSKIAGMPNLVALDPQYLVAAMKDYKTGRRKNDTMKSMLASVPDSTLGHIALYFGLQKPARAQTPSSGDQVAGAEAAAGCAGCHGDKGMSTNPAIPSLAGQDTQYLGAALRAYKNGTRADETMKGLASSLDDSAIKNIPTYYAALEPQPLNIRKPLSAEEWAQRCDRCHGVNGNSSDPRLPALAGQRADYLEKVLQAYKTGERKSPQMAAMAGALTDDDIKNMAAYYSSQKARAFVFVTVPSK